MRSLITMLAHIPLLRIDRESIPFAGGDLWRLPFSQYDALSMGAFSDHRDSYEKTAPVFYRFEAEIDLPILQIGEMEQGGAIEMKMRSDNLVFLERLNLGFIEYFHQAFVDRAWKALLIAAPGTVLPIPRLSVTYAIPTGKTPAYFVMNETLRGEVIRLQGDADGEYLFMSETASAPLTLDVVQEADHLMALLDTATETPELAASIEGLAAATAPSLSPAEQLTLAVAALEELLLPDVRSQLTATFSRRLAALLGQDDDSRETLEQLGRRLYKTRSALVHGDSLPAEDERAESIRRAHGQLLLGAAIAELGRRLSEGQTMDALRQQMDDAPAPSVKKLDLGSPPGLRHPDRLLRKHLSDIVGFTSGTALQASEGIVLSWSPLVGLTSDETIVWHENFAPVVVPLSGLDVIGLEDRDISRDFISQLSTDSHPVASMAIGINDSGEYFKRHAAIDFLHRMRDLAVIALRLCGFSTFHDPELLGAFVYQGKHRLRQGSVFRQTLLQQLRQKPESRILPDDGARLGLAWEMLQKYQETARHPDIDQVLTLYRRSFDARFQPYLTRASLMLSALEAMLGRFRRWKDPVQLEDLVSQIAGESEAVAWFSSEGRSYRNAIAHDSWSPADEGDHDPIAFLQNVLSAVLPVYLACWMNLPDRSDRRPGPALIEQVTKHVLASG